MNELQALDFNLEDVNVQDETFKINDLNGLNWAFRKLSAYTAKSNEIKMLAKIERDRIKSWEEKQLLEIKDSTAFFERIVQDYHSRILELNPKDKTLSTPYGKSKTRASKAQPESVDNEKLLEHVLSNDMQDYVKKEVKWGDFKKTLTVTEKDGVSVAVDETGQVVPGVSIKPESISFSVEVV